MNEVLKAALANWRDLNRVLNTLREDQVLEMLKYEQWHEKRETVLTRLHQRYNTLRVAREREELLDNCLI